MIRKFIMTLAALCYGATPALAQSWTTSARTVTWAVPPVIGDGVDRVAEVSSSAQGGDPPALASEPAAIDENSKYTRTAWEQGPGTRTSTGEAKFRTTCNFSHFGTFDPIVFHGVSTAGHHHTFIGNESVDSNSTYTTLRNNPRSTCAGGPLNATAYWEPTLMYEVQTGVILPVKPNVVTFYYVVPLATVTEDYRLLRGLAFIGGVDPADPLNTTHLAEIPGGAGWDTTGSRYDGWGGWQCVGGTVDPASTADVNPQTGFPRQLVNADGTDPWSGTCEGNDKYLVANIEAPGCWDGYNLTSPNGRQHFRYAIRKGDNSYNDVCPQGWWKVPAFSAKPEFPNGRGSVTGHAWRSKLYLSSDRMDASPLNWRPRGSTFHFDWMNGWDSVVMATWLKNCPGVTINGVAGTPLTCGDSTISDATKMLVGNASPDPTLSNDPIITFHYYSSESAKTAFGPVTTGVTVSATMHHTH